MKHEGLAQILDPRICYEYNKEKLDRMFKVALLCVADDRDTRPQMSKVVELLSKFDDSSSTASTPDHETIKIVS